LLKNGGFVKTKRYQNAQYLGDPINILRIFDAYNVDEFIVTDIMATRQRKEPDYAYLKLLASECSSPLTYGGGVNSLEVGLRVLECGVEKVSINRGNPQRSEIIAQLSDKVGNQCVQVVLDVVRSSQGEARMFDYVTMKMTRRTLVDELNEIAQVPFGEILVNCVDREGTRAGLDLSVVRFLCPRVRVPVIVGGGINSKVDIQDAFDQGASGVAVGTWFSLYGKHGGVLMSYQNL
jgi:cyclase